MPNHFRYTVTCAFCGKWGPYLDECVAKQTGMEKAKMANDPNCQPNKENPSSGEGTCKGQCFCVWQPLLKESGGSGGVRPHPLVVDKTPVWRGGLVPNLWCNTPPPPHTHTLEQKSIRNTRPQRKILLPSAVHLEERLTVSQSVS